MANIEKISAPISIEGEKRVTGTGYQVIPATGYEWQNSGGGAYVWSAWKQITAATTEDDYLIGMVHEGQSLAGRGQIEIGTGGAGAESAILTITSWHTQTNPAAPQYFQYPIAIASGTRIAFRVRDSVGGRTHTVTLLYIEQTDLVDL